MRLFIQITFITFLSIVIPFSYTNANANEKLTSQQQEALNDIHTLLSNNPDHIVDIQQSLQQFFGNLHGQQEAAYRWLFKSNTSPILGDPAAERSIIVFTDYDCPYCKRLEPVLEQLVDEYPGIQVRYILTPLRQTLVQGTQTNSALYAQGVWLNDESSFKAVHDMLMSKSGLHNQQSLAAVARATGTPQLLENNPGISATIEQNLSVFTALGLRGTPAILIDNQIIPGLVPYEQLQQIVEEWQSE